MNAIQKMQTWDAVRNYRYRFFNASGTLQASLVLCSTSDDEACYLAAALLRRSECSTVAVYDDGGKLIYEIGRDGGHENEPSVLRHATVT